MSTHEQTAPAYLYRLAPASAAEVQALAVRVLDGDGWTFGGALLWDAKEMGAQNLRLIKSLPAGAEPPVEGDFGHAFNRRAEVRWKRTDAVRYDVLVLAEQPLALPDLLQVTHNLRADPAERLVAAQSDDHTPLWGRYYCGPGKGVVLVRYSDVRNAEL